VSGSCCSISEGIWYVDLFPIPGFNKRREIHVLIVICQSAGIHKAAKETIALAEQRFLSQKHEWKFDNAWQEMLNQATIRVSK